MTLYVIEAVGPAGIPLRVRCQTCGDRWQRPHYDRRAQTLNVWRDDHECAGSITGNGDMSCSAGPPDGATAPAADGNS